MSRPDADERIHTHPWRRAYSIVLKGSYREERLIGLDAKRGAIVGTRRIRWFNKITSTDAHRIIELYHKRYGSAPIRRVTSSRRKGSHVWTLFIMGEYFQKWGFMDKVYTGYRVNSSNAVRPYIRGAISLHPYDESPRGNTEVKHYGNCRLWQNGEATHRDRPLRTVK